MNKKTIARLARRLYPRRASRQPIRETKQVWRLSFGWETAVPNLDAIKQGLMHLSLFWRRLAIFAGTVRTQVMVEIERNPLAVRQGAATVMCLAAAAVAMPVISYRAAEQRDGAEWAVTSTAFQAELAQQLAQGGEPDARVELTSFRTGDGLRARGSASLFESADARAMMVQAVLRGPTMPTEAPRPAEQTVNPREHDCLSQAIYYEARGETQRGQVAVAEVVMNRVRSGYYPNSVCAVVYQGSARSTGCQFTFTCDGSLGQRPRGRAWDRAQRLATAVMLGYTRPVTQHATHYHTNAVNPVWSAGLVETTTIGTHIFYRSPNGSERAQYQEALARRRSTAGFGRAAVEDLIPEAQSPVEDATAQAVVAPPAATVAPATVATPVHETTAQAAPRTPEVAT
jgi:spore germination cell wall hydrolase CwlJ-like protein